MPDLMAFLRVVFGLCCGGMLISAVVAIGAMRGAKQAPNDTEF